MSAKVIKCKEPIELAPFFVPTIGDTEEVVRGTSEFVVPPFDPATMEVEPPQVELVHVPTTPEDILESARLEAARIIAEAEKSKELLEQAAFEKAQVDAKAAIEAEVEAQVSEIKEQLAGTIEKLANLSNDIVTHVESDLVELAIQIARKIVRREVTIDREIALTLVRVSLAKLNQRTAAEVHLNPEDLAFVNTRLNSIDFRGALTLVEDPSIPLGGCLIHTETGDVDARIDSQFDEIAFGLFN